jgi:hypothetical protein
MSGDGLPRDKARKPTAARDQQPDRISKFSDVGQDWRANARKLGGLWLERIIRCRYWWHRSCLEVFKKPLQAGVIMAPDTIALVWWPHGPLVPIVDMAADVRPVGCDARGGVQRAGE